MKQLKKLPRHYIFFVREKKKTIIVYILRQQTPHQHITDMSSTVNSDGQKWLIYNDFETWGTKLRKNNLKDQSGTSK